MTADWAVEPESFAFTPENLAKADAYIAKYPDGRQASAVMPLLDLAQRQQNGWLSKAAIEYVADYLGMPIIRVYEVVSFYVMYFDKPVGTHVVWVCTTTPCWLRGSEEVLDACRENLGIEVGETTDDGTFTLLEQECLGACVNSPMMQIGDHYYEDLDREKTIAVLDALRRGEQPPIGSQSGRQTSAPQSGPKVLIDIEQMGES
ncbi:MAG: NADH-quinone oxidoreductase subunit NuoE [Alphaproteobacteria bacterium]|nr:NADH-quinone oxidoreductase subunit NuoE [Alphaproteobacteria bacterium]